MITLTICGEKPLDSGQLGPKTTAKERSIHEDPLPLRQQVIWLCRSGACAGLPNDQGLALEAGDQDEQTVLISPWVGSHPNNRR